VALGLLERSDWKAQWIADPMTRNRSVDLGPHHGYRSQIENQCDVEKWIIFDLQEEFPLNVVTLFSTWLYVLRPFTNYPDLPGYLFLLRFRIDVASKVDFSDCVIVVNRTREGIPNPVITPQTYRFAKTRARFVKLLVPRLRDHGDNKFGMALAEIQVCEGEKNVARRARIYVSDRDENAGGSW
jgi:hypothetical protein